MAKVIGFGMDENDIMRIEGKFDSVKKQYGISKGFIALAAIDYVLDKFMDDSKFRTMILNYTSKDAENE